MRGQYIIKAGDKEIPVLFGTWAIMRFCEINGNMSFSDMQKALGEISFKHIISLMLCGAEYWCRKNNQTFSFNDLDAAEWVDEMGGLQSDQMVELLLVLGKAINPDYQKVEVVEKANEEEKKI